MKFGFMEDFRNPKQWRRPFPALYKAIFDQIVRCEELGYDNIWLTEHHFTEDGYNPSLLPTAAAVAARTSRIRIGTFVLLLPFQHPVRVAEDATCVDIISNGRFDLGVGQGYSYMEFNAFCMKREERSARLDEGVRLIQRLWNEDHVSFEGKFTRVKDMTLSPKPVQNPMPLWIGARAEKAVRRVARRGAHLMATLGPDPAPWYIDELKKTGRDPQDFNIAQLRLVYTAANEDQAWEDVAPHLHSMMEFYGHILAEANDAPGDKEVWQFKHHSEIRNSAFGRAAMVGTPDQVAHKLEQFQKEFQCTHLIMLTQLPGLDPKRATGAFELFAKEVMPGFRKT
ncbi:MAG TPA: LLM class flavin-dependent oxidoreductase [Methylomirabilota bacterium]|jgi:alkanesulfonate monooxygenase SsuD/methylene tetrahydromethanopterin reductase-like flavin-dependent oxidoreductase (luciferase family)|nr:LLM class flavin-dependent oxidoreductase [Methylomirabilota bacterium]